METPTHLFDKLVAVLRRTSGLDDGGCPTVSWAPAFDAAGLAMDAVPCRIQTTPDTETVLRDVEKAIDSHYMYCAVTDISVADRVVYLGAQFNVVAAYDPDDQHVYMRLSLEAVV